MARNRPPAAGACRSNQSVISATQPATPLFGPVTTCPHNHSLTWYRLRRSGTRFGRIGGAVYRPASLQALATRDAVVVDDFITLTTLFRSTRARLRRQPDL